MRPLQPGLAGWRRVEAPQQLVGVASARWIHVELPLLHQSLGGIVHRISGSITRLKTRQFPDFKREKDGTALWIDNEKTPSWVEEKLNVEGNLWNPPPSISSNDDLRQDLIGSPHAWEDCRTNKPKPTHPDFKRKEDGTSLWLDRYTPGWVATKLMKIEVE